MNFAATNYVNLISWQGTARCEPPLTKSLPDENLFKIVKNDAVDEHLPKFPCHTQGTERRIRLVTEASSSVFSGDQGMALFVPESNLGV